MIVIAARHDLRDENTMADEAFALSPISARAKLPSAEDYDAISEAFMETSRGRWFLGEYAKRNRNADTRMVLDAVARIEETIAAQRQPAAESRLAEALAEIGSALDQARSAAAAAIDSPAVEENLAPIRKGARIIGEIAWRWREIGADSRICDLLDSQVSAIEGACGQIVSNSPMGALSAAFDLIEARIAEFGDGAAAPRPTEEANPSPSPAAPDETPAATAARAEGADAMAEDDEVSAEAADAYDESVLDLIALEMADPEPSDLDDVSEMETGEIHVAELPAAEPVMLAQGPEPIPAPALPPAIEPSRLPAPQPAVQPSLGSSLIANGIVRKPNAPESDPLAPIRRMSQAEKIAFFS
jgi:hypothetical protein